jgi:diguanylate cyclase (GGDEF)-like protein
MRQEAVTEIVESQSDLDYLVHHDTLTGLMNRPGLMREYASFIANHATDDLSALIYIDLDHFKDINDARGRASGDSLLASVARRLASVVAPDDLLARAGGDEFVWVARVGDAAKLDDILKRLMARVGEVIEVDGAEFGITVSMGVTLIPTHATDINVLLRQADIALSKAKEQGRESYVLFAHEMEVRLEARVAMEQALRRAVGTSQLYLEYQPIFEVGGGGPVAAEALLRWEHPELGLVSPATFIPIAEQSAMIIGLGDWVLREACAQIVRWRECGAVVVPVYVNVSPRQLERGGLQSKVALVMAEFSIGEGELCFEITERSVVRHVELNLNTLQALRAHGARIAVDDFGTGYSSLSYLKHLPIDALKIDRSFIRDMCRSSHDLAIVAAIVVMAHTLNLRTVAEGVETPAQLACLAELKCDYVQGHHLGSPGSAQALYSRLALAVNTPVSVGIESEVARAQ